MHLVSQKPLIGLSTALVPHPQNLLLSQHRHISLISSGSWNAKVSRCLLAVEWAS